MMIQMTFQMMTDSVDAKIKSEHDDADSDDDCWCQWL